MDGEAVLLSVDGISDFNGLHSRQRDDEVQFHAFDCLVSGEDVHKLPLSMRKAGLPGTGASRASSYPTSAGGIGRTCSATPA
jgi:ATP-dependent DNA ligase